MNNKFLRFLSLILAFAMMLPMIPAVSAAGEPTKKPSEFSEADYAALDPLWEQITYAENQVLSVQGVDSLENADIARIAQVVTASEFYVPDSIVWQGDGRFTFRTTSGIPCVYSSHLREESRRTKFAADAFSEPGTVVTEYGTDDTSSNDVYLIGPYYGIDANFTSQYRNEAQSIARAMGGTYTLYQTDDATIDNVAAALQSGAVVIFDSHGDTDYSRGEDHVSKATTSYLCLQSGTGITSADYAGNHAMYGGGYGSMRYYLVDGTAITNHMTAPNPGACLLWMAICLGMATDGLYAPIRDFGVDVVYGYSQSVSFTGDYQYEAAFWNRMKEGFTVGEAISYMKATHGNWDPAYKSYTFERAIAEYVAFPIAVSDQDIYPGHGNVDNYQTVNSTYTLFGSYEISAVSADESMGTVSVGGRTVTAYPAPGCRTGSAVLSPADAATVTREGDVFYLTDVTADCCLTVSFEAKTPAQVCFSTPDGVSQGDMVSYVGDSITLPAPAGAPAANTYDYTFLGWTDAPLNGSTTRPVCLAVGSEYTVTAADTTLYALYRYTVPIQASDFLRVSGDKELWDSEIVITGGSRVLLADGSITDSTIGSTSAARTLETTGMHISGDRLTDVTSDYVFAVEPVPDSDYYTIRMKDSDHYLSCSTNSNMLSTTTNPGSTRAHWQLSFADGSLVIRNKTYSSRYLQYNDSAYLFRCYTGAQTPLTVYMSATLTCFYTTTLSDHIHTYTDNVTAPTCTEQGYTTHTCADCGDSYTDSYTDALGHAWDEGCVTVSPTENAEGTLTFTCTRCAETREESLPALVCPSAPFADVDTAKWYHAGIDYVVSNGYMSGLSDTAFGVDGKITRAQFVTILYSVAGKPDVSGISNPFTDVRSGSWYENAVLWAVSEGITGGTSATAFSPNDTVTRAQIAMFLYAFADKPQVTEDALSGFADAGQIPGYARDAMNWAVSEGLISGTDETHVSPKVVATRAQIATIIMNFVSGN